MARFASKNTNANTVRADVYQTVTDKIVAQLENGVRAWAKPWEDGQQSFAVLPTRSCGERYRGINVVMLWGVMQERGYSQPMFVTYNQAQELGGNVRKGEKASLVVYFNTVTREVEGENGTEERAIPFAKTYSVFNVEQCDGLPASCFRSAPVQPVEEVTTAANEFFARAGVRVQHGGNRAFYSPSHDVVQMPPVSAFRDLESYQATLAHEAVHWTGHDSRKARTFGRRFGDDAYAVEELVAELGAAFMCGSLGLSIEPRDDHASYLASWLKVLKQDKRAIFTAASQAQAACDFLHEAAERGAMAQAA